jgi:hypothetical protein
LASFLGNIVRLKQFVAVVMIDVEMFFKLKCRRVLE